MASSRHYTSEGDEEIFGFRGSTRGNEGANKKPCRTCTDFKTWTAGQKQKPKPAQEVQFLIS